MRGRPTVISPAWSNNERERERTRLIEFSANGVRGSLLSTCQIWAIFLFTSYRHADNHVKCRITNILTASPLHHHSIRLSAAISRAADADSVSHHTQRISGARSGLRHVIWLPHIHYIKMESDIIGCNISTTNTIVVQCKTSWYKQGSGLMKGVKSN